MYIMICMSKRHIIATGFHFRNMCLKTFELDPARFLSVLGLVWQASLKKEKVK